MESNSFFASALNDAEDVDSRFWIRSTQVSQQVPRSQLFSFEPPAVEDFKNQIMEEEKN